MYVAQLNNLHHHSDAKLCLKFTVRVYFSLQINTNNELKYVFLKRFQFYCINELSFIVIK